MFYTTQQTVLVLFCLGCSLPLMASHASDKTDGRVEFRRAENQPAEGLIEAVVAGSDRKVYLYDIVEASNEDVQDIRVVRDSRGEPAIGITFTKDAADKIARLTERHEGKPIAVLVDGRVLTAPTVKSKLTREAVITGKFTIDEVERIVRTIKNHR
jgi:preprotein translocase subunit SecD